MDSNVKVPISNVKLYPLTLTERKRKSCGKKKANDPNYQFQENKRIEELRK